MVCRAPVPAGCASPTLVDSSVTIIGMACDYSWSRRIMRRDEVSVGELATVLSLGRRQASDSGRICLYTFIQLRFLYCPALERLLQSRQR